MTSTDIDAPDYCNICHNIALYSNHERHNTIRYIGWGNKHQAKPAERWLGNAAHRRRGYLNDIIYNIAFGYVQGLELKAVLYYVLTRHVLPRSFTNHIY